MKFVDKAVFLEKEKILVITDLHLGYEQGLQEQGVFIPKTQYKKTLEDLNKIFNEINKNKSVNKKTAGNKENKLGDKSDFSFNNKKIKEIIILGDLKHEFSGVSQQEWKEVLDLLGYLKTKTKKIILIKGNHDNYLVNVVKKQGVKLKDYYIKEVGKEKVCFIHGYKLFSECLDKSIKTIIMGHLHPSISIIKNVKKEIYKCFLVGKFKGKEIVILPSFFPLVEGADITIEDTNLAFKLDLKNFEVYVPIPGKVLKLGKVKEIGKLV